MNVYDKSKVGKFIGWGGDHIVFEYGEDKVIKFSIIDYLLGKNGREKAAYDYRMCRKYFGEYILETEITISASGRFVANIQPKVKGVYLCKDHLKHELIRPQYEEIMSCYRRMLDETHVPIDLTGRTGVFRGSLSNIFVTDDNRLLIFDATLIELHTIPAFAPILRVMRRALLWRQNQVIHNFSTA